MKSKIVKVRFSTVEHYIRLFNGIYDLTQSEIRVLGQFVLVYLNLQKINSDKNPFSKEMKQLVAKRLGKDNYHTLNTYIKALADKGAIKKEDTGYGINPHLIPTGESEIIFRIKKNS